MLQIWHTSSVRIQRHMSLAHLCTVEGAYQLIFPPAVVHIILLDLSLPYRFCPLRGLRIHFPHQMYGGLQSVDYMCLA